MSLSGASLDFAANHASPEWDLGPCLSLVRRVDEALRVRLITSLDYLSEFARLDHRSSRDALDERLRSAPVSPWVFCLYSKLVSEISNSANADAARTFDALVHAASLPARHGVVAFRDRTFSSSWWDQFQTVLDTDRNCPFKPSIAPEESIAACKRDIDRGLTIMQHADPDWHAEIHSLLRMAVLASPESPDLDHFFNGASSFFVWGGVLLNATLRRSAMSILEVLVHEASHGLLFGLAAEVGLTRNSSTERDGSPVRVDKRPIDGIFHACFVATRVHLAMGRLLTSGLLSQTDRTTATMHRDCSRKAALESLKVLQQHATLTELGEEMLLKIRSYWGKVSGAPPGF